MHTKFKVGLFLKFTEETMIVKIVLKGQLV